MIETEEIERYRAMHQEDRMEFFRSLMNFAWASLLELPADERRRRLEYAQVEHAESNAQLAKKFQALP